MISGFADSYGRKFIVRFPEFNNKFTKCWFSVSSLNKMTNVAVTRTIVTFKNQSETVSRKLNQNSERYYDCSHSIIINYIIMSDDDVAVVIFYKSENEIKSTSVYPVDTFGKNFMLLVDGQPERKCKFISEYTNVNVTAYFSAEPSRPQSIPDSKTMVVSPSSELFLSKDISGASLIFNKPSMVFCFNPTEASNINYHLPVDTWSNEYVVPGINMESHMDLKGSLHIMSYADNTIVQISNGFNAILTLCNKGDKIIQEIDIAVPYRVNASNIIAVGLYTHDLQNKSQTSFILLPSVQNHHNTILTSLPSNHYSGEIKTQTEIWIFSVNKNLQTNREMFTLNKNSQDNLQRNISTGEAKYEITVVRTGINWFIVPGNVKAQHFLQVSYNSFFANV